MVKNALLVQFVKKFLTGSVRMKINVWISYVCIVKPAL